MSADEQARKRAKRLRRRFPLLARRMKYRQPPIIRMIGHDHLPRDLRMALYASGVNFSPFEVGNLMNRGMSIAAIIALMRRVEKDQERKPEVSPARAANAARPVPAAPTTTPVGGAGSRTP